MEKPRPPAALLFLSGRGRHLKEAQHNDRSRFQDRFMASLARRKRRHPDSRAPDRCRGAVPEVAAGALGRSGARRALRTARPADAAVPQVDRLRPDGRRGASRLRGSSIRSPQNTTLALNPRRRLKSKKR
jgi:hypothetical protein